MSSDTEFVNTMITHAVSSRMPHKVVATLYNIVESGISVTILGSAIVRPELMENLADDSCLSPLKPYILDEKMRDNIEIGIKQVRKQLSEGRQSVERFIEISLRESGSDISIVAVETRIDTIQTIGVMITPRNK